MLASKLRRIEVVLPTDALVVVLLVSAPLGAVPRVLAAGGGVGDGGSEGLRLLVGAMLDALVDPKAVLRLPIAQLKVLLRVAVVLPRDVAFGVAPVDFADAVAVLLLPVMLLDVPLPARSI